MLKMPRGEIHHAASLATLPDAFHDYRLMMRLAKPVFQNFVYFSLKHVFHPTFYINIHIFKSTLATRTHIFLKKLTILRNICVNYRISSS